MVFLFVVYCFLQPIGRLIPSDEAFGLPDNTQVQYQINPKP